MHFLSLPTGEISDCGQKKIHMWHTQYTSSSDVFCQCEVWPTVIVFLIEGGNHNLLIEDVPRALIIRIPMGLQHYGCPAYHTPVVIYYHNQKFPNRLDFMATSVSTFNLFSPEDSLHLIYLPFPTMRNCWKGLFKPAELALRFLFITLWQKNGLIEQLIVAYFVLPYHLLKKMCVISIIIFLITPFYKFWWRGKNIIYLSHPKHTPYFTPVLQNNNLVSILF